MFDTILPSFLETPAPPEHPFLENGQLKRPLKVFELAESLRTKGNLDTPENQPSFPDFFNSHFGSNYYGSIDSSAISHFGLHGNALNLVPIPDHMLYKRNDGNEKQNRKRNGDSAQGNHGENKETGKSDEKVKFIDNPSAPVHVEKIKFHSKKVNNKKEEEGNDDDAEVDDDEDSEIKNFDENIWEKRPKRETNATSDFVTVDEDRTEPDFDTRDGRRLELRRRLPQRQKVRLVSTNRPKRVSAIAKAKKDEVRQIKRKESEDSNEDESYDKEQSKRQILLGDPSVGYSLLGGEFGPLYGAMPLLGIPLPAIPQLEHEVPQHDENPLNAPEEEEVRDEENPGPSQPEPAEGEVRRIMGVCSGCDFDPFRKVAVISWRSTPKKIYSGALFIKAKSECRKF